MFKTLSISPAMRNSARYEADRLHAKHGAEAKAIVDGQLAKSGLSIRHRAFLKAVRGFLNDLT